MKKIKPTILMVVGGLMLAGLVYFALNAVAIGQRISFLFGYQNPVETMIGQEKMAGAGVMVNNPESFPEIFMAEDDQQIQNEYAESYQNNYLYIPSLGVEAPIVYLNQVDDQTLQSELKKGVGHYPDTALPGDAGNVFLFGHSSYYWWDWSDYSAIFANLENIKIGDKILVYYNDRLFIYEVLNTKVVAPTDLSVLDQSNGHNLTLMTCTPLGTSLNRFIVVAELVS